jgi:regulator of sirC expression with transglutaminase-like and TPR domain
MICWLALPVTADDAKPELTKPSASVEKLNEQARKSVVVVTFTGRDGRQQGLGSGFIIEPNGLIATNLHVIGEARPIRVQLTDGKSFDVTSVHAYDRNLDLALIRIDAKDLPALPLGDSSALKQGQAIMAIGNPHGLKHSVVAGVVSGTREIDNRSMIQLAIPIEPGNSGGPLLDMEGRVHGILTMKSLVTDNLGFAVPINSLKPLIEKPNPTAMARWLTIGSLDSKAWTSLFGSRWRQRAGRIVVDGTGQGFGGRSLCLSEQSLPELPFEFTVSVKLDDEAGAAGLAFCADGSDKHYGFYPSNGKVRLTRFDGPDVYSWHVLQELPVPNYRLGDWNALKVRLETGKIQCFVNDQLVVTSTDQNLKSGKVGLAKFRNTQAEFRGFRMAKELPQAASANDELARLLKQTEDLPATGRLPSDVVGKFTSSTAGNSLTSALEGKAKQLEQQASQLRKLAVSVHQTRTRGELSKVAAVEKDADIDLLRAALLIARIDNEEVDVEAYLGEVDRMAREIRDNLPAEAKDEKEPAKAEAARLAALNKYLFDEQGYHGSRGEYYHRSNSYLNEVIDDREGLPITLSVLYMELARRLNLKVEGVGLPGHFVARLVPSSGEPQVIDVYERGKSLSTEDVGQLVKENSGRAVLPEHLEAMHKRAILVRIIRNLLGLSQRDQNLEAMLGYLDTVVAVSPDSGEERFMRAVIYFQTRRRTEALAEADWLLEHKPRGVDLNRVTELRELVDRPER